MSKTQPPRHREHRGVTELFHGHSKRIVCRRMGDYGDDVVSGLRNSTAPALTIIRLASVKWFCIRVSGRANGKTGEVFVFSAPGDSYGHGPSLASVNHITILRLATNEAAHRCRIPQPLRRRQVVLRPGNRGRQRQHANRNQQQQAQTRNVFHVFPFLSVKTKRLTFASRRSVGFVQLTGLSRSHLTSTQRSIL